MIIKHCIVLILNALIKAYRQNVHNCINTDNFRIKTLLASRSLKATLRIKLMIPCYAYSIFHLIVINGKENVQNKNISTDYLNQTFFRICEKFTAQSLRLQFTSQRHDILYLVPVSSAVKGILLNSRYVYVWYSVVYTHPNRSRKLHTPCGLQYIFLSIGDLLQLWLHRTIYVHNKAEQSFRSQCACIYKYSENTNIS